jgi:diguanylate cyclase (GGDEF)-like protein
MAQAPRFESNFSEPRILADLPTPPTVGLEILRVSQDPDAPMEDLSRIIERDPALSVRVISMANSPAYLRRERVTNVHDAAVLLGRQAVSIVALSFSLAHDLQRTGSPAGLDLDLFWRRSLTTGTVARHIARAIRRHQAEEAFLAGLLCHLGKLVLAQKDSEAYSRLVGAADGWPTLRLEREQLGWTSLDVTLAVLREWNMAESVIDAIQHGVDPDPEPLAQVSELSQIIALAVAVDCSLHDVHDGESHRLLEERFRSMFGHDQTALAGLDAAFAEASELLDIPLPPDFEPEEVLSQARERMLATTLSVATEYTDQARRLEDLERENLELAERATTDSLTGLPNRRSFDETILREVSRRRRGHVPEALGVIMFDIDHFKRINDVYGHAFGDEVLKHVADALQTVARSDGTLHRYGGEEFVLVAPNSDPTALTAISERLRAAVEALDLRFGDERVPITVSAGAACAGDITGEHDARLLVLKADSLLYGAKRGGRNRVEVSPTTHL